jgi:hypothetical protein
MSASKKTVVTLVGDDCALVFRAGGDLELFLPKKKPEDIAGPAAIDAVRVAVRMAKEHKKKIDH